MPPAPFAASRSRARPQIASRGGFSNGTATAPATRRSTALSACPSRFEQLADGPGSPRAFRRDSLAPRGGMRGKPEPAGGSAFGTPASSASYMNRNAARKSHLANRHAALRALTAGLLGLGGGEHGLELPDRERDGGLGRPRGPAGSLVGDAGGPVPVQIEAVLHLRHRRPCRWRGTSRGRRFLPRRGARGTFSGPIPSPSGSPAAPTRPRRLRCCYPSVFPRA